MGKNGILSYQKLEREFAALTGYAHGVAVNSGTAALHLALVGLGVGTGDEVIVPDFSMVAAAFAVSYTGATPVFVDCGDDLLIDIKKIEDAITPCTKAIMPVHIYGRICDMQAIGAIAKKHGLKIIEDCAEVHGAKIGPADVSCFSFYRNKIVHAEEGGMIVTNDENLALNFQDLKSMAFGDRHDYYHTRIGFNYRMPDYQANLALESLAKLSETLKKRKEIEAWYEEYMPPVYKMPPREVVWVYDFLHPRRDDTVKRLREKGARHFFKPPSSFPMYGRVARNRKAHY
ncbi:MAG: DegT/DnrJ/EryC1/StrS family aminotransferase, partial [Parcubacteria group bacterium]|nr:DegT/DnrJ/EryC1/StrS family aminotransferase [Parcubacteria group bacterium]